MVISASRRTDVPAFFGDWFFNRLIQGEVLVRNPMNPGSVSRISLEPQDVDCFVFWTKNPRKFLEYLPRIDDLGYNYYFQYTLTPYDEGIEPGMGPKDRVIETFIELSEKIGKEKVIWRYDPILTGVGFGNAYHEDRFAHICGLLSRHTEKCVLSFVDEYRFLKEPFVKNGIEAPGPLEMFTLAKTLKSVTDRYGLGLAACSEKIGLGALGIPHGRCIDDGLIARILRRPVSYKKDTGQRKECGCHASRDIGSYNTCLHGCLYCYAKRGSRKPDYDKASPMLCDDLRGTDRISGVKAGEALTDVKEY